jgi:hypothetical protein
MRIALFALICLLLAIGLLFLTGWLLPATREGRAEAVIPAPPDRILAVIADVEAQPEWRDDVRSVLRDGADWTETTTRGERITFTPVVMTEGAIHLRFTSDAGYSGEWLAKLVPEDAGTRITVTERATVPSPFGRILSRLFFDPDAFATTYLSALAARSSSE